MKTHLFRFSLAVALLGTAAVASADELSGVLPDSLTGAGTLKVGSSSLAREVLRAIPAESALERFEYQNANGAKVAYAGLTEGEPAGLVFLEGHLAGTLSRPQAQAFYACRGYATATQRYWGRDASDWVATLTQVMTPATEATLTFSGVSAEKSIRSIVSNPLIGQVRSLVDIGTNPLNVVKTLDHARQSYRERERDKERLKALGAIEPGDPERKIADALKPETLFFIRPGLVMAYPRYSVEFYVAQGHVSVAQQPAFHQLAQEQAELFYQPELRWEQCEPTHWPQALKSGPTTR